MKITENRVVIMTPVIKEQAGYPMFPLMLWVSFPFSLAQLKKKSIFFLSSSHSKTNDVAYSRLPCHSHHQLMAIPT